MEDVVPEAAESLLHPASETLSSKEDEGVAIEKKEDEAAAGNGNNNQGGGLLDHLIHNLVSPLSPEAGGGDGKKVEAFESSDNIGGKSGNLGSSSEEEQVGGDINVNSAASAADGGFIKNAISNFFHQSDPDAAAAAADDDDDHHHHQVVTEIEQIGDDEKETVRSAGGGFVKNAISNFFHQSTGADAANDNDNDHQVVTKTEKNGDDEEEMVRSAVVVDEENGKAKTQSGGGGIIDNIVSHLPTSLPGDATLTSDEASILISIVQD